MMNKLNSSYEELPGVYEELTATESELREQYVALSQNQKTLEQSEEKYRQMASYDPLTKLYNTTMFLEKLNEEIRINRVKRNFEKCRYGNL